ncbi:helix-turn-helix domain-containing protein [Chitinophaga sp. YIM B06452]|uniref:helix-turn-helix domain-containing protein n=1 Tax=Chitinophaga sp. YIM B06452 TaxID=3082158 RepID=UPI0031FE68B6
MISNEQYLAALGSRLKKLREDAGYKSAESFAVDHKISRTQYLGYEKGKDMRITSLRKIATIHKLTPEDLLKGLESRPS